MIGIQITALFLVTSITINIILAYKYIKNPKLKKSEKIKKLETKIARIKGQKKAVKNRIQNNANQRIQNDLNQELRTHPIWHIINKDTKEYLKEHPEEAINVIKNYNQPAKILTNFTPQIAKIITNLLQEYKNLNQDKKRKPYNLG